MTAGGNGFASIVWAKRSRLETSLSDQVRNALSPAPASVSPAVSQVNGIERLVPLILVRPLGRVRGRGIIGTVLPCSPWLSRTANAPVGPLPPARSEKEGELERPDSESPWLNPPRRPYSARPWPYNGYNPLVLRSDLDRGTTPFLPIVAEIPSPPTRFTTPTRESGLFSFFPPTSSHLRACFSRCSWPKPG